MSVSVISRISRRRFVILLALLAAVAAAPGASLTAAERRTLVVRETAGIRRFGYPVSAILELDAPFPADARFRLLEDGRALPAQFRRLEAAAGAPGKVAIDFEGNFLPGAEKRYTVELGADATADSEPAGGLRLERAAGDYRIRNGSELEYLLRADLSGLIASVKTKEREWIAPGGSGLAIRTKGGARVPLAGAGPASGLRARVVKEGPVDCVILFERSPADGELRRASSSVELEFPRSKSWVRVDWRVEDPEGAVVGLEAEVALALGEGPALADFGAGSFVYAALAKDQVGALEAGTPAGEEVDGRAPAWKVLRGAPGRLEPYAIGPPPGKGPAPEGWAHLMDARRCTALAVAFFAREAADRIEADAAGRLRIARAFAAPGKSPRPGLRRLVFWLHFVDFPPQVGAVTSPQSMQSPLETSWER